MVVPIFTGRPCTICQHPHREAIDYALAVSGETIVAIADRHGVSKHSLHRHKASHARPVRAMQIPAASPTRTLQGEVLDSPAPSSEPLAYLGARAELRELALTVKSVVHQARDVGDWRITIAGADAFARMLFRLLEIEAPEAGPQSVQQIVREILTDPDPGRRDAGA